jgi:hypothetical protein
LNIRECVQGVSDPLARNCQETPRSPVAITSDAADKLPAELASAKCFSR